MKSRVFGSDRSPRNANLGFKIHVLRILGRTYQLNRFTVTECQVVRGVGSASKKEELSHYKS